MKKTTIVQLAEAVSDPDFCVKMTMMIPEAEIEALFMTNPTKTYPNLNVSRSLILKIAPEVPLAVVFVWLIHPG